MSSDIPDRIGIHISKIREHLWSNRAVVMVGAGFSKNATPQHGAVSPFPSWGQLVEKMIEELHPNGLNEWEKAQAIAQAPEIAEQYQRVFDRGKLRSSIQDAIPDGEYAPNDLYELLLNLPWQDVFTTNYDTLLERSLPELDPRQFYNLVRSSEELPYAEQPRIIKLHGDLELPNSPLIITREDYRTYPQDYPAFVNTVRQALMENILVLVGFSGDDPNFKQWFGWVRDVLEERRHQVYLCGLLNLSERQQAVYDHEGIVPLDLAEVVPPGCASSHERSLRWFFCSLHNGKPRSGRQWPQDVFSLPNGCSENFALDPIPPDAELHSIPEWCDEEDNIIADSLRELTATWKHNRGLYPGWVVMPRTNRQNLWRDTEKWIDRVKEHAHILDREGQLRLASEIAWRYQRSLRPIQQWLLEWGYELLSHFEPDSDETWTSRTEEQRSDWFQLAIVVLQNHRRNWNSDAFDFLVGVMKPLARFKPAWAAWWHYEQCLYHLGRGHHRAVRKQIKAWNKKDVLPFWSVRRASILAELGDIEEARKIAEDALEALRKLNRIPGNRIRDYSREAFAMLVVITLRSASDKFQRSEMLRMVRSDRWDELASKRCDPRRDLNHLTDRLASKNIPGTGSQREVWIDPETGRTSSVHSSTSFRGVEEWQPAIELLWTLERGGIPIKAQFVRGASDIKTAALWMRDIAPQYALSTLVRSVHRKDTIAFFEDHLDVSPPDFERAEEWYEVFITAARESLDVVSEASDYRHQEKLKIFSSLLGKIGPYLSEPSCANVLDFTIQMYEEVPTGIQQGGGNDVQCLLNGTLPYLPPEVISNYLDDIFSLPLDAKFGRGTDPFRYLGHAKLRKAFEQYLNYEMGAGSEKSKLREAISAAIDELSNRSDGVVRTRALQRLITAFRAVILQRDEQQRLGDALWGSVSNSELPDLGDYYPWIVLRLPAPEGVSPKQVLRVWLTDGGIASGSRDSDFLKTWTPDNPGETIQRDKVVSWIQSAAPIDPDESQVEERTRENHIRWSWNEVEPLLFELKHRLAALKRWKSSRSERWGDGIGASFRLMQEKAAWETWSQVPSLLRRVVFPTLRADTVATQETDEGVDQVLHDLITDLIEMQMGGRSTLPELLDYTGKWEDEAVALIQRGFSGPDVRSAIDAAEAVYRWAVLAEQRDGRPVPDKLVSALVRYTSHGGEALAGVLRWTSHLVRHAPAVLHRDLVEELVRTCLSVLSDTSPPDLSKRLEYSQEDRSGVFGGKIKERKRVAELALVLYKALRVNKGEICEYNELSADMESWPEDIRERLHGHLQDLRQDPYPQVRRMWKNVVEELKIESEFGDEK